MMTPLYSVVIPIKDEEDNIEELVKELEPVMEGLRKPWELIFVEDGSTDSSLKILKKLLKKKNYMHVISFSNNYGQSSAFDSGFKAAKGEFIITLDGDRQNDPNDIPKLLKEIENCDLVCGWRTERKDSEFKKVISWTANLIRGHLCRDYIHDTGCSLKVYRSSCLKYVKLYHGMHRFLPALFKIEGFRIKEVPVNHRERTEGESKYNIFNRSIAPIVDMFVVAWMRKRQLRYQVNQTLKSTANND